MSCCLKPFPASPSTAVKLQQANPLPDLPPTSTLRKPLHMLTVAGFAGLHLKESKKMGSNGHSSCLCERGRQRSSKTRQSSAARAPYPSCAHSPRGTASARHLRAQPAAHGALHRTWSTRCVVLCPIDGRERALESNFSRICRYRYICKCIYLIQQLI